MSYKIQYAPEAIHKYPQQKKQRHINWMNVLFISSVILAALWMRVNGVPDFLIPGEPEVTKAAAAVMVEQIQRGDAIDDAIVAFCKEILDATAYETIC